MQIDMDSKIVEVLTKLRAQATARRMPLDVYLEQFVEPNVTKCHVSLAEYDQALAELDVLSPPRSSLPADFSRADIYAEHD